MRTLFGLLLFLHGLLHLLGFIGPFGLGDRWLPAALRPIATRLETGEIGVLLMAVLWLLMAGALTLAGLSSFVFPSWWPAYTALVLIGSLVLSIVASPRCLEARAGVVVNLLLLAMLGFSSLADRLL